MFKKMSEVTLPSFQPKDLHLDTLWHALRFHPNIDPESRPGWSGYMSMTSRGDYPGKSMVHILPIIDLDLNGMSCIYSTLSFIIQQSQELELQTPIVTFDQPLWIKANEIVHAKCINIVLILGGFHTIKSFAGSIASLMSGSGLAESLETCYDKNTIRHMLTGKTIARALRGHFLVVAVLEETLMRPFLMINKKSSNTEVEGNDKAQTDTSFFYRKNFHKKMSLQNPKTLRKC